MKKTRAKMCKILQKIAFNPKKLAQLEKISTDGVTRVNLFMHLCLRRHKLEICNKHDDVAACRC